MADERDILEQLRLKRLELLQDEIDRGMSKHKELGQISQAEIGDPTTQGYKVPLDIFQSTSSNPIPNGFWDKLNNQNETVSDINERTDLQKMKRFEPLFTPIKKGK